MLSEESISGFKTEFEKEFENTDPIEKISDAVKIGMFMANTVSEAMFEKHGTFMTYQYLMYLCRPMEARAFVEYLCYLVFSRVAGDFNETI